MMVLVPPGNESAVLGNENDEFGTQGHWNCCIGQWKWWFRYLKSGQNDDSGSGNAVLYPDTNNDEENQASRAIDLLSNGFKLRTSNATFNASGNYVYLAFAENPFKYATAR